MRADTLLQPLALLCTRKEVFVSIFPDVAYSEKHSNAGDFVQKYDMSMLPQLLPTWTLIAGTVFFGLNTELTLGVATRCAELLGVGG